MVLDELAERLYIVDLVLQLITSFLYTGLHSLAVLIELAQLFLRFFIDVIILVNFHLIIRLTVIILDQFIGKVVVIKAYLGQEKVSVRYFLLGLLLLRSCSA